MRFQSCQPCFAFGGKGGQSRDPFAPTKKKIATMSPTLSPSSVVLPEAEEKSELNSSFEKEKKKDSEDDDENNSSENILPTPRERRRESEAKIPSRESEIQFVSLSEVSHRHTRSNERGPVSRECFTIRQTEQGDQISQ